MAKHKRKSKRKYLPDVAVLIDIRPDPRTQMLKTIEPKKLEGVGSVTIDMNQSVTINPLASVMMTGRVRQ